MQAILVLNSGSSSVKFAAYEVGKPAPVLQFRGLLDRHTHGNRIVIKDATGKPVRDNESSSHDFKTDLAATILERIEPLLGDKKVVAVGHRIVHGGPDFSVPVRINAEIIRKLERLIPLAPLHQPRSRSQHPVVPAEALPGRMFRYRRPSRASPDLPSVCAAAQLRSKRNSSLRLPWAFVRIHCPAVEPAEPPRGGSSPWKRLQPLRDL
jgi:hypothetical protein